MIVWSCRKDDDSGLIAQICRTNVDENVRNDRPRRTYLDP